MGRKRKQEKKEQALVPADSDKDYMSLLEGIQVTGSPKDLMQSAENVGSAIAGISAMLRYWDRIHKKPDDVAKVFLLLGGIAGKIAAGYVSTIQRIEEEYKTPSERVEELQRELFELQQIKRIRELEEEIKRLRAELEKKGTSG